MREFFPANFAERVVILHKYPKGRISNLTSLWFGNVSQKAVKLARATDGFLK